MVAPWLRWLLPRPRSVGERGERAAARFLRRAGYQIVARQHRDTYGEIDLIVSDGRALIFVEVKTRTRTYDQHPAESVDRTKQRRMQRTAQAYVQRHRLGDTPLRFDIVAITWPTGQRPRIEHFPGAFESPDL